jgi:pimeloyl-ACP methyl ester carboxylesterase
MNETPPASKELGVWCLSPSGLHRMAYTEWGASDNPKVLICVHGLARNARDFDDLARAMATDYRVICPDVVGRGRSDWLRDPAGYDIHQYLADMMVLIARLDVTSVYWLGTSMGGLIGMVLASLENTPVTRLLLNDVGPVISPGSIKRIGEYIGRAPKFDTYGDAEKYIRLVSAPFGALTDAQWRHLTESSLRPVADGRLEMRYDPGIAESLRSVTPAEEVELWAIYDRIRCPTLVLRGEKSDLLTLETVQAMAGRGPRPAVVEVPGVGHAPMFMNDMQIDIARDFFHG